MAKKSSAARRSPRKTATSRSKTGAKAPTRSALDGVLTTTELLALAKRNLRPESWDFIVGGAETDTTTLRNRHALDSIALRPRVLRNVEAASPATTFLNAPQRLPVLLAPLASLTDMHAEGALPVARAAAAFGCLMLVSSVTKPDFGEIARVPKLEFALQLYPDGDEAWVLDTAKRGADAGARAICVTVDVPTFGRRERILHRRQSIAGRPFGALRAGEANRGRADWSLIEKLKLAVDLPLMLKGIQTAEDASLAVKQGVDVIYVSNHGGRQLDHGRGAIDLLPEVVSEGRSKATFVVDGGFVRGTDVLKGLARGAAMVGIGKLQALAFGAAGEAGVVRLLEILEAELTVSMKLLGVNRCDELDGTFLQPSAPMVMPGVFSAFPQFSP
jgi:isopentenyl diphosphate isomerase/L-lactate dehydrogenase-like FMN-dependent dehydrogenase